MTRAIAIAALLTASAALADNNLDEARAHFKRGTQLYDEGDYRAALIEFERAYENSPNYKLLYNIGQVQLQLQDYARAHKAFSQYLVEGAAEIPPARRDEVQAELEVLKARVGKITVETAAGAEVLLDDESLGFAPLPGPVAVNTGRHKLTVIVAGQPMNRVFEIAGLQQLQLVLGNERPAAAAAPAPAVPVVVAPPPSTGVRGSAIAMWVVTGAVAIGAGTFGVLASGQSTTLARSRDTFGVTRAELDSEASRVRTYSTLSDSLTAAALLSGGVALWLTLAPANPQPVAFGVGPSGVAVRGTF